METNDDQCDIMNKLFELDLDEIIQRVFLSLDPLSLKNCRCVCSEWSEFIQKRLWGSRPAKTQLKKRLINQWKFSEPFQTQFDEGASGVNFLVCDDDLVVCGYTRGQARAYDACTGELRYELQCISHPVRFYDGVQLDLGKKVLASVTDTGTVSIWNRNDGTLLYQGKHHGDHESHVFGIKVTDDYVLTGAGDGSFFILESINGEWKIAHKMFDNKEGITHIDADGKWAVTGTRKSVKLWDLNERKLIESIKPVLVKVWMLSFIYPHVFVVGGEDWNGVQIWDMVKCVKIRHILEEKLPYHNIHTNRRFLTISEYNDTWAGEHHESCSVSVYDVLELVNTKIEDKNLWFKDSDYLPGEYFEQVNAVTNTTSLIVSHASKLSISNFWKDRITPSQDFTPPEAANAEEEEMEDDTLDWEIPDEAWETPDEDV